MATGRVQRRDRCQMRYAVRPNPSLQGTLREKPRKAPELKRWGSMNRVYLLLAVLVSACATQEPANHSALESEVAALVHEGTSLDHAIEALTSNGFSCAEGTFIEPKRKGVFECVRSRGPLWPPYACIHRVWFEAGSSGSQISKLQVFKPACASF